MFNKIFEPINIGVMEIKNRLVVPPMVMNYVDTDGKANERFIAYLEERARGGWGLIIPENYTIDYEARGFVSVPGLWSDDQITSHRRLTDRIHQYGSKIVVQLNHAGRQTTSKITGVQPVAPSAIPDPVVGEMPKTLNKDEIDVIVKQFGQAALRAKQAGFDGIEIHGCHGYLINQFMSAFSNKRTDEYGGNLYNRARFAIEIIREIKTQVGDAFPIIYRMTVNEFVEEGLNTNESKAIAMLLESEGVDAIHATNGIYASKDYIIPPNSIPEGWSSHISAEIKSVVSIPVITVGRIIDPKMAESILLSDQADLVSMGRASLADPFLPNKAKSGQTDEITQCIGCLQGCVGRNSKQLPVECRVNPMTGNEHKQ